jgi:hypothetical protein
MQKPYFLLSVLILSGCATPLTESERTPQLAERPRASITIGVLDRREDVLSGKHADTWERLGHGVYGIPYFHHTKSGEAMATYLAEMIQRGVRASGGEAIIVKLSAGASVEEAKKRLMASPGDRKFLLVLNNWYVDYGNTSIELFYDADVRIFGSNGDLLASKVFQGSEVTEFGLIASYYDQMEKAHKKRLEAIVSNYAIAKAL